MQSMERRDRNVCIMGGHSKFWEDFNLLTRQEVDMEITLNSGQICGWR